MIRFCYRDESNCVRHDLSAGDVAAILGSGRGVLWVDFENEPPEACQPLLLDTFHFHPLAVDDALRETHVPKVDDWGDYLYLVLSSLSYRESQGEVELAAVELDVFFGANYIVTHHDAPVAPLDRVWDAHSQEARHRQIEPEHLLYEITDEIATSLMALVEHLDDAIDKLENDIFRASDTFTFERIFDLKRALLRLRRTVSPLREVMNRLARDDYAVIDPRSRVFFRDVYDHMVRLYDITESLRDLLSGALDMYLSVINNRMNEIMKTLTVITTLFMPLSFITGFFGMNFFGPVAPFSVWTDRPVFLLALAVILLTPLFMYLWMRRRAWM